MRNYISLSLFLIILASCYQKQEGCLDIRARNYDFGADESCDDCCVFPTMKLGVTHLWGDTTLMKDSIYTTSTGQEIRILNAQFLLSNISLIDGQNKATVLETVQVLDENDVSFTRPDNFAEVQTTRFSYPVGTFSQAKNYDGLQMTFGVDDRFTNNGIVENTSMFDETTLTYSNFRMQYIYQDDTLVYALAGPTNTQVVTLEGILELPIGIDFTIPVKVNYQNFLQGVDVGTIQSGESDLLLLQNISSFFTF